MPLVYQQDINDSTVLGVWHIQEDENFFLLKVPLIAEVSHAHKRLQHLAGRYLLKEMFPLFPLDLIQIADAKKPYLADSQYHFSLSHCGDYAAAIVSRDFRVGIDIEKPQEKIKKISAKFLNVEEVEVIKSFPADPLENLTAAWSIKEAMYKWYGFGAVDFKNHMHIVSVEHTDDFFTAHCVFNKMESIALKVEGTIIEDHLLAWVLH